MTRYINKTLVQPTQSSHMCNESSLNNRLMRPTAQNIYIYIYIPKHCCCTTTYLIRSARSPYPRGNPAERVPEVGGVSWQHPGEPDKPRQDPGDQPNSWRGLGGKGRAWETQSSPKSFEKRLFSLQKGQAAMLGVPVPDMSRMRQQAIPAATRHQHSQRRLHVREVPLPSLCLGRTHPASAVQQDYRHAR